MTKIIHSWSLYVTEVSLCFIICDRDCIVLWSFYQTLHMVRSSVRYHVPVFITNHQSKLLLNLIFLS